MRAFHDRDAKDAAVLETVKDMPGTGLIYAATRRQAAGLAAATPAGPVSP